MADISKWFQWQPVLSEGQTVRDRTIRLQAQAISIITPFGGFVWNRPTAVFVEKGGITDEVPIVDVTRYALIGIGILGGLGMMLVKVIGGMSKETT